MDKPVLKYHSADPDNCRVYFTAPLKNGGRGIYCFQGEGRDLRDFVWYRCSEEGEPSHYFQPVPFFDFDIREMGDLPIEKKCRKILLYVPKFLVGLDHPRV